MCSGIAVLAGLKLSAKPMITPVFASQNGRLKAKVLSFAKPTITGWLLIAKPLEKVPPGISPKSVMVICDPLGVYLIDFTSSAFVITLSAKLMVAMNSFTVCFLRSVILPALDRTH